MDAKQYKEITGLCNFEGLKSLLKNADAFEGFSCSDETIVLNRVLVQSGGTSLLLKRNQFAVILQLATQSSVNEQNGIAANTMVLMPIPLSTFDANGNNIAITGDMLCQGVVCVQEISMPRGTLQFALFDLY